MTCAIFLSLLAVLQPHFQLASPAVGSEITLGNETSAAEQVGQLLADQPLSGQSSASPTWTTPLTLLTEASTFTSSRPRRGETAGASAPTVTEDKGVTSEPTQDATAGDENASQSITSDMGTSDVLHISQMTVLHEAHRTSLLPAITTRGTASVSSRVPTDGDEFFDTPSTSAAAHEASEQRSASIKSATTTPTDFEATLTFTSFQETTSPSLPNYASPIISIVVSDTTASASEEETPTSTVSGSDSTHIVHPLRSMSATVSTAAPKSSKSERAPTAELTGMQSDSPLVDPTLNSSFSAFGGSIGTSPARPTVSVKAGDTGPAIVTTEFISDNRTTPQIRSPIPSPYQTTKESVQTLIAATNANVLSTIKTTVPPIQSSPFFATDSTMETSGASSQTNTISTIQPSDQTLMQTKVFAITGAANTATKLNVLSIHNTVLSTSHATTSAQMTPHVMNPLQSSQQSSGPTGETSSKMPLTTLTPSTVDLMAETQGASLRSTSGKVLDQKASTSSAKESTLSQSNGSLTKQIPARSQSYVNRKTIQASLTMPSTVTPMQPIAPSSVSLASIKIPPSSVPTIMSPIATPVSVASSPMVPGKNTATGGAIIEALTHTQRPNVATSTPTIVYTTTNKATEVGRTDARHAMGIVTSESTSGISREEKSPGGFATSATQSRNPTLYLTTVTSLRKSYTSMATALPAPPKTSEPLPAQPSLSMARSFTITPAPTQTSKTGDATTVTVATSLKLSTDNMKSTSMTKVTRRTPSIPMTTVTTTPQTTSSFTLTQAQTKTSKMQEETAAQFKTQANKITVTNAPDISETATTQSRFAGFGGELTIMAPQPASPVLGVTVMPPENSASMINFDTKSVEPVSAEATFSTVTAESIQSATLLTQVFPVSTLTPAKSIVESTAQAGNTTDSAATKTQKPTLNKESTETSENRFSTTTKPDLHLKAKSTDVIEYLTTFTQSPRPVMGSKVAVQTEATPRQTSKATETQTVTNAAQLRQLKEAEQSVTRDFSSGLAMTASTLTGPVIKEVQRTAFVTIITTKSGQSLEIPSTPRTTGLAATLTESTQSVSTAAQIVSPTILMPNSSRPMTTQTTRSAAEVTTASTQTAVLPPTSNKRATVTAHSQKPEATQTSDASSRSPRHHSTHVARGSRTVATVSMTPVEKVSPYKTSAGDSPESTTQIRTSAADSTLSTTFSGPKQRPIPNLPTSASALTSTQLMSSQRKETTHFTPKELPAAPTGEVRSATTDATTAPLQNPTAQLKPTQVSSNTAPKSVPTTQTGASETTETQSTQTGPANTTAVSTHLPVSRLTTKSQSKEGSALTTSQTSISMAHALMTSLPSPTTTETPKYSEIMSPTMLISQTTTSTQATQPSSVKTSQRKITATPSSVTSEAEAAVTRDKETTTQPDTSPPASATTSQNSPPTRNIPGADSTQPLSSSSNASAPIPATSSAEQQQMDPIFLRSSQGNVVFFQYRPKIAAVRRLVFDHPIVVRTSFVSNISADSVEQHEPN